jgi:hypothetical protein
MRKEAYRPTPGCRSWLSPTAFPKAMVRCCRNRAAILPMTSPRGPAFRPVQSSWHALSLFFVKFFALLLLLLIRFSSYTLLGVWLCVGAEQYLLAEVSIFLPNVTAFCVHIRIYISFVWRRRRSHARLARFPLRVVKTHTHKKKKSTFDDGLQTPGPPAQRRRVPARAASKQRLENDRGYNLFQVLYLLERFSDGFSCA